jgi:EmrB/QacA subfamily drug resistance transporter
MDKTVTVRAQFEGPTEQGHPRRRGARRVAYGCVVVVMGMVSVVNLAIPKLSAGDLNLSASQLLWVVDSYTIVFACLLIPIGALADRYGRKGFLLAGLACYVAGCLGSGLAPTTALLLAARLLTGAGAAFVFPATMSIIVNTHVGADRPKKLAGWTVALQAAGILAATIGGLVVQAGGWRLMFLTFAVLGTGALVCVAAYVPRTTNASSRVDLVGSAQLIVGVTGLLYPIIEGPALGWTSPAVLGSAVAGLASLAWYGVRAWGNPACVLDTTLFRIPIMRAGTLGVLVGYLGMFAMFYTNSQYLQFIKGYPPAVAGLATLPMALWNPVASSASLRVAGTIGVRYAVAAGFGLLFVGQLLLSTLSPATPYGMLLLYMLVMGTGIGVCAPLLTNAIVESVPPDRAGSGSGVNSFVRELGSATGIAVMGTIIQASYFRGAGRTASFSDLLTRRGDGDHPGLASAFTHGIDLGYRTIAVATCTAAILVFWWLRGTPAKR